MSDEDGRADGGGGCARRAWRIACRACRPPNLKIAVLDESALRSRSDVLLVRRGRSRCWEHGRLSHRVGPVDANASGETQKARSASGRALPEDLFQKVTRNTGRQVELRWVLNVRRRRGRQCALSATGPHPTPTSATHALESPPRNCEPEPVPPGEGLTMIVPRRWLRCASGAWTRAAGARPAPRLSAPVCRGDAEPPADLAGRILEPTIDAG